MIKNINNWLNQAPKEAIDILMNGKKIKVIPQKEIETLLDKLTDRTWETKNFTSSVRTEIIGGKPVNLMDASLELVIRYKVGTEIVERTLVGAVTFDTSYFGNTYHNNTAKSMCITNAATDISTRFGKYLNPLPVMVGMQQPVQIPEGFSEEAKGKINATLEGIKNDMNLVKKIGQ